MFGGVVDVGTCCSVQIKTMPIFLSSEPFGPCGDSKEWNVLDLRYVGGVPRFGIGGGPTPRGLGIGNTAGSGNY